MIERALGWALQKVVEDEVDDSMATAAAMGVVLDTAAFKAMGLPAAGAMAAGAASGVAPKVLRKIREKHKEGS